MRTRLMVTALLLSVYGASPGKAGAQDYSHGDYTIGQQSGVEILGRMELPDLDVLTTIEDICSHVGLKPNFVAYPANVPNAIAYAVGPSRVIMYNPEFLKQAHDRSDSPDWAAISVLAHEIGHHLQGHIFANDVDFRKRELEADHFSGFLLYRMGATLTETQAYPRAMMQDFETASHPGRELRMEMIEAGWRQAEAIAMHEQDLAQKRAKKSLRQDD